jgi:hypothetical protein
MSKALAALVVIAASCSSNAPPPLQSTVEHACAKGGKLAILGIEVYGTISPTDTRVASELTRALRMQPKPDELAPGGDKEMVDQKLLFDCEREAAGCMAAIGSHLGADRMLYGRLAREPRAGQDGYRVTIKLLDVANRRVLASWTDFIPLAEAKERIEAWARAAYDKLVASAPATCVT